MDIKNLNTFIHVAELGSFSHAGDALGYSQPTVSVQIRQLETEFGAKLFDRIGHAVRLTAKGRELLPYAQQICQMSLQLLHATQSPSQPQGNVRLGIADSLCAPLVGNSFSHFHAQHPQVRLDLRTAGTKALFDMLDHNEVDLVCTLDSHIYDANYVIAHEQKIGVHFVAGTQHPLADSPSVAITTLLEHPFLLTEKGMSYRRLLDERLAQMSLELTPALVMSSAHLLCQLVTENAGIAFLPDYVTDSALALGQLVRLNVSDFDISVWGQLLYRKDKWLSPAMQAVIAHLSQITL